MGSEIRSLGVTDVRVIGSGSYVGGLIGVNGDVGELVTPSGAVWLTSTSEGGRVSQSYSTGAVSGHRHVGGLVGFNVGAVTQCWHGTGGVTGNLFTGGLLGSNYSSVSNSYSNCGVNGGSYVGGLIGSVSNGRVWNCYSAGTVSGTSNKGGLVGSGLLRCVEDGDCFWDSQIIPTLVGTNTGGTPLPTDEMQDILTYVDAGWDFVGEMTNGTDEIWQIPDEGGYPILNVDGPGTPPEMRGKGTADDPYLVSDAAEIKAIWRYPTAYYRLATDIDLSGITWPAAVVPDFSGTFDGNDLCIRNMTITGRRHLGLFGRLSSNARILRLSMVEVDVYGTGDYVGGLVGENKGLLYNCSSSGTIRGTYQVGGLIGENNGSRPASGSVECCYSMAEVNGTSGVGGLVGTNSGGVQNSYSTGQVSASKYSVGGLVGQNEGSLEKCYSIGRVKSGSSDYVGGLVGSGPTDRVKYSFWDNQISGQTKSAGGTGQETADMQTAETFLGAGWDFAGVWQIPEWSGYPLLRLNGYHMPSMRGSGSAGDPYIVSSAPHLQAVAYNPTSCYRLAADIDLSGRTYYGAIVPVFLGVFDGNGLSIGNLRIEGVSYVGPFGKLTSTAMVKGLRMTNVNVVGREYIGGLIGANGDPFGLGGVVIDCSSTGSVKSTTSGHVGGLVGANYGSIARCHSGAAVSARDVAGGLAGANSGTIVNCSSDGPVSGGGFIGGLVGDNDPRGDVMQCYSSGEVMGVEQGSYCIGGLAGGNGGIMTRCYSVGVVSAIGNLSSSIGGLVGDNRDVGTVASCFWNMQNTPDGVGNLDPDPNGVTGKTTTEMQTAETFIGAGWDFVNIWWIDEGRDYPRLWWELPAEE